MQKYSKQNSGFTIIELAVSIFILSVAVIGIFTAFSIVTILTSESVDRLGAIYLAQEGMEIVRNIRDTNWIKMKSCAEGEDCDYAWLDGLSCETGCEVDYTSYLAAASGNRYLNNDANGFYSYNGCASGVTSCQTKFKRRVVITPVADSDGLSDHIAKAFVYVSWDQKATILNAGGKTADQASCPGSGCVVVEEILYDWYNYKK